MPSTSTTTSGYQNVGQQTAFGAWLEDLQRQLLLQQMQQLGYLTPFNPQSEAQIAALQKGMVQGGELDIQRGEETFQRQIREMAAMRGMTPGDTPVMASAAPGLAEFARQRGQLANQAAMWGAQSRLGLMQQYPQLTQGIGNLMGQAGGQQNQLRMGQGQSFSQQSQSQPWYSQLGGIGQAVGAGGELIRGIPTFANAISGLGSWIGGLF